MFNRYQIILAYYHYYNNYHEGQGSYKYQRLCKICGYFSPGIYSQYTKSLMHTDNAEAKSIYLELGGKLEDML